MTRKKVGMMCLGRVLVNKNVFVESTRLKIDQVCYFFELGLTARVDNYKKIIKNLISILEFYGLIYFFYPFVEKIFSNLLGRLENLKVAWIIIFLLIEDVPFHVRDFLLSNFIIILSQFGIVSFSLCQ